MGIHLNDLPPKVREQVARKMVRGATPQSRKRDSSPCAGEPLGERFETSAVTTRNDSEGKYHNKKVERAVGDQRILFDSQKEARRFDELVLMQRAGTIKDLRLQVDFTLQEAYTMAETGNRVRAIRYRADFTYLERVRDDFGWCVQGSVAADDPSVSCADSSAPLLSQGDISPAGGITPCAGEHLEERIATSAAPPRNDSAEGKGWRYVVEDVKSEATKTRTYQLKRKLMLDRYGIQIREV